MILHDLISVSKTAETDIYIASVDITDAEGERYVADYVSRPNDKFGLAPKVREAITDWIAAGKTVSSYTPPVPTVSDVIRERTRRLAAGFDYDFGDARGVHRIGTTEQDMDGWDEVSKFAQALINAGDATTQIDIVTNTGPAKVTAPEWNAILIASAQFRQPIWGGSFVLQAMDPIPIDFQEDSYWAV